MKYDRWDIVMLRSCLGLSQVEFALKLGVNLSTVSKWECEQRFPGISSQMKLNDLAASLKGETDEV